MTMNNFNSLIIGMGNIGYRYDKGLDPSYKLTHLSSQKSIKQINKIYCLDNKNFSLQKSNKTSKLVGKIEMIKKLRDSNIGLVTISTPTNTHYKIINKVLFYLSPKVILLEKPGTKNSQNFLRILKKCNSKGIILFCNYYRNYDFFFQKILKYIQKGPCEIIIKYSDNIYVNLPHFINYLNFFLKGKYKISILKIKKPRNKKINNDVLLEFQNFKIYILQNLNGINEITIDNKSFLINSSENFNRFVVLKKNKSIFFKKKKFIKKAILMSNINLKRYQKIVYDKIFQNFKNKRYSNLLNKKNYKTLQILNSIEKKI